MYLEWKEGVIAEATKEGGGGKKAELKAIERYAGWLKGTMLITPKQIRALVEEMKAIDELELSFGEVQVDKEWGVPLAGTVIVAKHMFRFSRNTPIRELRDKVIAAIERSKSDKGKVVGELEDGIERVYQISKNAGTFEEMDCDEVANELTIDLDTPADSIVVKKMQAAISQRPDYFVRPKKAKKPKDQMPATEGGAPVQGATT